MKATDVNLGNSNNWTPLHSAVFNKNEDIVNVLLLRPDIDLETKNIHGKTAEELAEAVKSLDILYAIQAVKRKKEVLSQNFITACKNGDIKKVKATIGSVDVNNQDGVHKNTGQG